MFEYNFFWPLRLVSQRGRINTREVRRDSDLFHRCAVMTARLCFFPSVPSFVVLCFSFIVNSIETISHISLERCRKQNLYLDLSISYVFTGNRVSRRTVKHILVFSSLAAFFLVLLINIHTSSLLLPAGFHAIHNTLGHNQEKRYTKVYHDSTRQTENSIFSSKTCFSDEFC